MLLNRDELWWTLAGPSGFIQRVLGELMRGRSVVMALPRHAPHDLVSRLCSEVERRTHIEYRNIDIGACTHPIRLLLNQAAAGGPVPKTLRDLIVSPAAGKTLYVISIGDSISVETVKELITRITHSLDRVETNHRSRARFLILIQEPGACQSIEALIGKYVTNKNLFITGWRSVVSESDMVGYVGALMHERPGPGPINLYEAYVRFFGGFDRDFAGTLHQLSDDGLLQIDVFLAEQVAGMRRVDKLWSHGMVEQAGQKTLTHALCPAWTIANTQPGSVEYNAAVRFLAQIEWRAQLSCVFPWLEEVRVDYLTQCYKEGLEERIEKNRKNLRDEVYRSIEDFEYSDVSYFVRHEGLRNRWGNDHFVNTASLVRNDLAHRRPVKPARILEMIQAWQDTC